MRVSGMIVDVVQLPVGVLKAEGEIDRTFELKGLTGKALKEIAGKKVRRNYGRVVDTVLQNAVINVGGERPSLAVLQELTVADREFLMLKAREFSLGVRIESKVMCPNPDCSAQLDVDVDLHDVETWELEEEDYRIEKDLFVFDAKSEELGIEATFKFPTGKEQVLFAKAMVENPVVAQQGIYAACLLSWKGDTGPFGSNFCDSLPLMELKWVGQEFVDRMPGPDVELWVTCDVCGYKFRTLMESSDFLFPQVERKRSSSSRRR